MMSHRPGLIPTMPLEREAAYNNWRKTFSDLQVEKYLQSFATTQFSEARGEGGEVCLFVNKCRRDEHQSQSQQVRTLNKHYKSQNREILKSSTNPVEVKTSSSISIYNDNFESNFD